jgi:hypothetical protein
VDMAIAAAMAGTADGAGVLASSVAHFWVWALVPRLPELMRSRRITRLVTMRLHRLPTMRNLPIRGTTLATDEW